MTENFKPNNDSPVMAIVTWVRAHRKIQVMLESHYLKALKYLGFAHQFKIKKLKGILNYPVVSKINS